MALFETERLSLRRLRLQDAAFTRALMNEPGYLRHIGDKGIRTLDDARRHLREGPLAMYRRHGFGLYRVARTSDGEALGICGLVKREGLADVDLGYAFLGRFWGHGYAREAALAVLTHAYRDIGLTRVVAITAPGNDASRRVLESVGFAAAGRITLPGTGRESLLFVRELADAPQAIAMTCAK